MKRQLTEKVVYEPNEKIKVTVQNKPVFNEGAIDGYDRTVTIKINAGFDMNKLTFSTDEDIAKFIETVDFEDPQQALSLGGKK